MAVSTYRTIVLPQYPRAYDEQLTYLLRWPAAEPDDNLDYSLSMAADLADVADSIVSVAVSINPAGELTAASPSVDGSLITVWLSGGVPGRDYQVKVEVGTEAFRVYEWLVQLLVDATLGTFPPVPYPTPGFSVPVVWVSFSLDFSADTNSQYLAVI